MVIVVGFVPSKAPKYDLSEWHRVPSGPSPSRCFLRRHLDQRPVQHRRLKLQPGVELCLNRSINNLLQSFPNHYVAAAAQEARLRFLREQR